MRLALRFILPLAVVLGAAGYSILPVVDTLTLKWFTRDLEIRSRLILNTFQEPLSELILTNSKDKVLSFFNRAIQDERLFALGFCDLQQKLKYMTLTFPSQIQCQNPEELIDNESMNRVLKLEHGPVHVATYDIVNNNQVLGRLILVHDMSFIERRSEDTQRYFFYFFVGLAAVISLMTVVIARLSWQNWVARMRSLLKRGRLLRSPSDLRSRDWIPLVKDLRTLIRDLESDRKTRDESQITWSPQTLRTILKEDLAGDEILIVSNREPYIHIKKSSGEIDVQFPASGLVTALEPIMRACSGTWIAHGSGSADREVVDGKDHIRVPPNDPSYQLRRVWLTHEEEEGYYLGFSNEGLWPLCHIAHTRPTFRSQDWESYVRVNEKFAQAVFQESKTEDPVVLVQDYHFALLPKMIWEKLPQATILTFWHIPWPNPEAFAICPWREEILDGLLKSSILGFHTRFHCNNFIDTVDRFLETRIERETSMISHNGKLTAVKNYPISIEWPPRWTKDQKSIRQLRSEIRQNNQILPDTRIGIGVDRMDYTKGILERFLAIERFFELFPQWIGKFTFIQIAALSRSKIDQYQNFEYQVRALAQKINSRFGKIDHYEPIILKTDHHEPDRVFEHYRASDVCLVTSLHDGMNLVAKEFISARDDEQGVLILSQFTGAGVAGSFNCEITLISVPLR